MGKAEEIFKMECHVLRHTERAVKIMEPEGEELWIPISQIIDYEDLPSDGKAEIKMTAWIAKEKGLI